MCKQDLSKERLLAEKDRCVRIQSVENDFRLNLPVSIALPDGEEYPYGSHYRIRDKEQVSSLALSNNNYLSIGCQY